MRRATPQKARVLYHIQHFGPLTVAQLAEGLGITQAIASTAVWQLRREGKVHQRGSRPFSYAAGASRG